MLLTAKIALLVIAVACGWVAERRMSYVFIMCPLRYPGWRNTVYNAIRVTYIYVIAALALVWVVAIISR